MKSTDNIIPDHKLPKELVETTKLLRSGAFYPGYIFKGWYRDKLDRLMPIWYKPVQRTGKDYRKQNYEN